jgi:hypothetical protein
MFVKILCSLAVRIRLKVKFGVVLVSVLVYDYNMPQFVDFIFLSPYYSLTFICLTCLLDSVQQCYLLIMCKFLLLNLADFFIKKFSLSKVHWHSFG